MIKDSELTEWQGLCDTATSGPWLLDNSAPAAVYQDDSAGRVIFLAGEPFLPPRPNEETIANIMLAITARAALPEAIAEIRELRNALMVSEQYRRSYADGKFKLYSNRRAYARLCRQRRRRTALLAQSREGSKRYRYYRKLY